MNTDDLISHSRARFDHVAAKRILKEKYEAKMLFAYGGGMWRAGPELLVMLQSVPIENAVVLLDLYDNPVKVSALELQHLAFERWQEQMNAWLVEHNELSNRR
jgi:hypothetical protein